MPKCLCVGLEGFIFCAPHTLDTLLACFQDFSETSLYPGVVVTGIFFWCLILVPGKLSCVESEGMEDGVKGEVEKRKGMCIKKEDRKR